MADTPRPLRGLPMRRDDRFAPATGLAELRDRHPISPMIYPDGHRGWLVTGHDLAREVLSSPHFSNRPELLHSPLDAPLPTQERPQTQPGFFLNMDPPDHTRLRRMLTGQFTVKRMRALEPRVEAIVAERIDAVLAAGPPADLVAEFALPVPSLVICELLGVDYDDRDGFQTDSHTLMDLRVPVEERIAARERIGAFMLRTAHRKRGRPDDGLLGSLVHSGELDDAELAGVGFLMLLAGHETTANMLALGTFALLEHPDQAELLRARPALMPQAVEELMRFLSIVHMGPTRCATADVRIDGRLVTAGSNVTVSVPAANHDPRRFDGPDRLDVTRPGTGHVGFGHGVHQCLGQQPARPEMRIGFDALLRRLPGLALAVDAKAVPMRSDMGLYGVHELPVTWRQE
ncbi:cytochrome P450 [Stackebrandtia albiflava]|uniref:Cytochrome P450 n=1 Tax=Stackebrandtia albiflava TaxID=406432 RepID=A0A562V1P2_9ACTN|nr:cytochrome P450 [Stackebrandtia albiflava]TWJ11840.1 cytochrome P450 [Stackebrandtia albiflava]